MNPFIATTLEQACDPKRLVLLVYDMQVGVVNQIADGATVTARVLQVLDTARRAGVRTVFTRHMSLPVALMGASQLRTAMAWQHTDDAAQVVSSFPRDSPQFQLVPELAPSPDEAIFDKITMSAFEGTPLDFALRDSGVDAIAIVGVALEIGIEPTVRHALDRGFLPVVVTDACGAGNRAAAQRSLDQLTFFGGTLTTDTDTLCELLQKQAATPPTA